MEQRITHLRVTPWGCLDTVAPASERPVALPWMPGSAHIRRWLRSEPIAAGRVHLAPICSAVSDSALLTSTRRESLQSLSNQGYYEVNMTKSHALDAVRQTQPDSPARGCSQRWLNQATDGYFALSMFAAIRFSEQSIVVYCTPSASLCFINRYCSHRPLGACSTRHLSARGLFLRSQL